MCVCVLDNSVDLVVSFHLVGPWARTQVGGLDGSHLYLLRSYQIEILNLWGDKGTLVGTLPSYCSARNDASVLLLVWHFTYYHYQTDVPGHTALAARLQMVSLARHHDTHLFDPSTQRLGQPWLHSKTWGGGDSHKQKQTPDNCWGASFYLTCWLPILEKR